MNFKYTAATKDGKERRGSVDAETEAHARQQLKRQGLYLLSMKEEATGPTTKKRFSFSFGLKRTLSIQLARQLASLLKGGVPLFQALTIIANQLPGEREKEIVGHLRDQVRGGVAFSEALKSYPGIFDNLFVYSVSAGEKTGALRSILAYQADLLENRALIRGKITTALVYPATMSIVGTGVLLFLLGYVVPMVTKLFTRTNQALPLPTQILINLTGLIDDHLVVGAVSAVACIVLIVQWVKRSPSGRRLWDRLALGAPVFGGLYQMILINQFARIMSTLLKSGVHMLQSLVVVSSTMKNSIAANAVTDMSKMVERGTDLSAALRENGVFPGYVADIVAVGETSGNLEEMLTTVSDYYEANASQKIAALTSMVEPLIIVLIGVVVAFILVSILLPLFEMNKVLAQ
jgi:general secretion pathway protein F